MLWIKAFHIIAMTAWFAGLFYLPRLFVYHAEAKDKLSIERFKMMERRLYFGIMWPAALFTTLLGFTLITYLPGYYLHAAWLHVKLVFVGLLWIYHAGCGYYLKQFQCDKNIRSSKFYRIVNEVPTIFLIAIVLLAVVKPFRY